jgi:deoxyribodipyrimidine photo-lyase
MTFYFSDNWAFIYAQKMALQARVPLHVVFCLVSKFGVCATIRAYKFLLGGLREVQAECTQLNIPFYLLIGPAKDVLPDFVKKEKVRLIICDFWPLRGPLSWIEDLKVELADAEVGFQQVDAHNIVPVWEASDKEEIGARTLRGKIHKQKEKFHTAFPPVIKHPFGAATFEPPNVDWEKAERDLDVDRSVDAVDWAKPGTSFAFQTLREFLTKRLPNYAKRNDPNVQALSNLSPWFHFGQISVARAILEAEQAVKNKVTVEGMTKSLDFRHLNQSINHSLTYFNEQIFLILTKIISNYPVALENNCQLIQ